MKVGTYFEASTLKVSKKRFFSAENKHFRSFLPSIRCTKYASIEVKTASAHLGPQSADIIVQEVLLFFQITIFRYHKNQTSYAGETILAKNVRKILSHLPMVHKTK